MTIESAKYFDDRVQSLATTRHGRKFSVGIISPGSYRFGTACAERMSVISGALRVKVEKPALPEVAGDSPSGGGPEVVYPAGTYFEVAANSGFAVAVDEPSAYLCEYL